MQVLYYCFRVIQHEPFLVINAEDYYGKEGFKKLHEYMVAEMEDDGEKMKLCMAGFILANTLSENGGVTRGICEADRNGNLKKVTETYEIYRDADRMHAVTKDGVPTFVSVNQHVSINMFVLPWIFRLNSVPFPKIEST